MGDQLLHTTMDCFYFVTRFFEPIDASAAHIYHSALELSPASSTIRDLYYHQCPTPFPRVVAGFPELWDPSIATSSIDYSSKSSIAWSPCGHFVVMQTKKAVEIRDSLTFGLLSTLKPIKPTTQLIGPLAYSPDGHSLACASNTAIIIWDIQTGGVAKELQCNKPPNESLVWSLDGGLVSVMAFNSETNTSTVCRYDVVSGTVLPPIIFQSESKPHLWAHDKSFCVMTSVQDSEAHTINICEIGSVLTNIKSFPVQLGEHNCQIKSFSPTTFHISTQTYNHPYQLLILDIENSGQLLNEGGVFYAPCFSPNGSLFAASLVEWLYTWEYDDGYYTPWRQFQTLAGSSSNLLFSPTSSSILANLGEIFKLWHFDSSYSDSTTYTQQFITFSCSGAYFATAYWQEATVTITNFLSQTPSQLIDPDIKVFGLGLIGNILLVVGSEIVVAWLLTEEGAVNGVFGSRRAGRGDSIWAVSISGFHLKDLIFLVEGEIGVVKSDGKILQICNMRTGGVLNPAQTPMHSDGPQHSLLDITQAWYDLYGGFTGDASPKDSWKPWQNTLKEGWLRDHEGRHLLWLPVEWRAIDWDKVEWHLNIATMQFLGPDFEIIAKLY